jgi:hypothetical protein
MFRGFVCLINREKILALLGLGPSTLCEYRSNKALLDAASSIKTDEQTFQHRGHFRDPRGPRGDDGSERRPGWGNGFRREQQQI